MMAGFTFPANEVGVVTFNKVSDVEDLVKRNKYNIHTICAEFIMLLMVGTYNQWDGVVIARRWTRDVWSAEGPPA